MKRVRLFSYIGALYCGEHPGPVEQVFVRAKNAKEARRMARAEMWDERLATVCDSSHVEVRRVRRDAP